MCSTMLPVSAFAAAGETFTVPNPGDNRHQFTGESEGASYEIWLDQTGGSGSMTLGSGGTFSTEWSCSVAQGNFLARRGMTFDRTKKATDIGNITLDYAAEYSASGGNSRLCVYGWMVDPLVEYYIIEDWVNWCPSGPSTTVTIDGAEYEIFTIDHTGPTILGDTRTFPQYFSIRKDKRTSGTITVSDHFKAWEKAGMSIGNLTEVAMNVEGWESSGKANVTKLDLTVGGTPVETTEAATTAPKETVPATEPASGYYYQEDFSSGAGKWTGRGDAKVAASDGVLSVTNRSDNWHGAAISLDSSTYIPGNSYSFSVMAKQDAAASDTMKLTLQYTLNGKENYDNVAEATASKGEWVQLANTSFTIPAGATNMLLYVEADSKTNSFVIDDAAIATKGTKIAASGESSDVVPTPAGKLMGDVNNNGELEITDIIALQKFLLGFKTEINFETTDMNSDNVIDIFDLALVKRAVINKQNNPDPVETVTEPVTEAPTEAPTTEPVTEAPTQAVRKEGYYYNTADVSWIDPNKPMVAFAFDDGPIANSNCPTRIQDAISAAGGHATFFYWGERIAGNENEIKRAQSLGMEIANHTWTHPHIGSLSTDQIKSEINQCAAKLTEITGQEDFLLRPPYLEATDTVKANCGCALVNCGIDSSDWAGASKDEIINKFTQAAANGTLNGQVLLMHENYESTAAAVEYLAPYLTAQGYQIVSVGEMFKAKGIDMKYGELYNKLP